MRGFEIVSTKVNDGLNLPKRSTQAAAGYDFEASEEIVIPSALSNPFFRGLNILSLGKLKNVRDDEDLQGLLRPVLVPTGIKAYMGEGEYLQLTQLFVSSSLPKYFGHSQLFVSIFIIKLFMHLRHKLLDALEESYIQDPQLSSQSFNKFEDRPFSK